MSDVVVCAVCACRYPSALPDGIGDGTQGDGCAASVWRDLDGGRVVLGAHWGSKHDLDRFVFQRDPLSSGTDPVCDTCIDGLLDSGRLVRVGPNWEKFW